MELSSAEQYRIPTVFASGTSFTKRSACSSMGFISDVPDTFPPGTSSLFTKPALTKSVTAVARMGISVVACAAACAAGVATARTDLLYIDKLSGNGRAIGNLALRILHVDIFPVEARFHQRVDKTVAGGVKSHMAPSAE